MADVMGLLTRVSKQEGNGSRLPDWLATHPNPEDRQKRIMAEAGKLPSGTGRAGFQRDRYLAQVDGVVYGQDPREGFFRGNTFYQPQMAIAIEAPAGWKGVNQRQSVVWTSPRQDALFGLTLAQGASARDAAQRFFAQQGVQTTGLWNAQPQQVESVAAGFSTSNAQNPLRGAAAFVESNGHVFELIGLSRPNDWSRFDQEVAQAIRSFRRVTDPNVLQVKPMTVQVVKLPQEMTLEEFARRYPSSVSVQELALVNNVDPGTRFQAGQEVKQVVGFNPERANGGR